LEGRSAAANYITLEGLEDGAVRFTDQETGEVHSVRARLVVNAAGPWIDQVNARLGTPTSYIGGTKGSHILLDHDELVRLLGDRMIYFEADDGRVCLVFPYLGLALVGSTDIRADDPDNVVCADEEIAYLLESLRNLLPGLTFSREQIVYTYSGIRPLPRSDAAVTGLISRDHSAPVCEPAADRPFPILSLVGGKWTTFRGFGEEVADEVLTRLGAARRTGTREMPIGGGKGFPLGASARGHWIAKTAAECGLAQDRIELLLDRYGTKASIVSRYLIEDAGDEPLTHVADYSTREIDYIARHEHVRHLEDIILRRTALAVLGLATGPLIAEVASIAGRALGWSGTRRAGEIEAVLRNLSTRHGVLFATASTD
jgi:glycerol-3-phosphate dehydrogenase